MFDFFIFNELQNSAAKHESSSHRSSRNSYGSSDSYVECDCDCDCGGGYDSCDGGNDSYDSCDCDCNW